MNRPQKFLFGALLAAAAATPSYGAAISVNYANSGSGTPVITGEVGLVPFSNWNNIFNNGVGGFQTPTQILNDSTGTATLMTATFANSVGSGGFNTNFADENADIYGDFVHAFASGATNTFQLRNIPYETFDLYLYNSGYGTVDSINFTLGATTLSVTGGNSPASTPVFIDGVSYVKFSGLTEANLDVTMEKTGGFETGLGGFQVVAVPEPSSVVLLGLSTALLGFRRKRKA